MDQKEAEDFNKRWQEYTGLYKKYLNDLDNHDGVITHLEPNILECKVKGALGSITTNKVNEWNSLVMEFQLSCFNFWKMMLWKWCSQYVSKFGKLSSGQKTGKGQFSFQSQRTMPKNVKLWHNCTCSHSSKKKKKNAQNSQARLQQYMNRELSDV